MNQIILNMNSFRSFPIERRAYNHVVGDACDVGEVHGKDHATLISTYLITQIESQCLIIWIGKLFLCKP